MRKEVKINKNMKKIQNNQEDYLTHDFKSLRLALTEGYKSVLCNINNTIIKKFKNQES
jgi:hypothetical protein